MSRTVFELEKQKPEFNQPLLLTLALDVRFVQVGSSALKPLANVGLSVNFQAPNNMQWKGFRWLQNAVRPQSFFLELGS